MITKVYWSPWKSAKLPLVLLALFSILGLFFVETFKVKKEQPNFKKKLVASKLAERAFQVLKPNLLKYKKPGFTELDPTESGLIGEFLTPVTSNTGSLSAKQTSINPNFAAVFLQYLKKSKLSDGDTVAVALSGSFPALNICLYAAIETLKLQPILIASASASQFGANQPLYMWLDMEKDLYEAGLFSFRTTHASIGGVLDSGMGMSKEGKDIILRSIQRNNVKLISPKDIEDSVTIRAKLYEELRDKKPIKAFVNIGGGTTILGTSLGKQVFKSGFLDGLPEETNVPNSVLRSFLEQDIPAINFIQIESLAKRYGLPISPKSMPKPGEGKIFYSEEYNPWLYGFLFLFLLGSLYGITKLGWGSLGDENLPKQVKPK